MKALAKLHFAYNNTPLNFTKLHISPYSSLSLYFSEYAFDSIHTFELRGSLKYLQCRPLYSLIPISLIEPMITEFIVCASLSEVATDSLDVVNYCNMKDKDSLVQFDHF